MDSQKKFHLAFFLTRGVSLTLWDNLGILKREIKPYQELANFFQKITIYTYGGREDLQYQKFFPNTVEIIPKSKFLPSIVYSFLLPFIQRKKLKQADSIKTNQMDGSWTAVIAKKLYGIHLVIRCGYEWLFTLEVSKKSFLKCTIARIVESVAYHAADRIIITTEADKKFIEERFKIKPDLITVIPNYIDTELFSPKDVAKEQGRIIFVGRLEKEKNVSSLIKALVGLDAHLVIIGEGSLREVLENLSKSLSVNVTFLGKISQENLPLELSQSQISVLPSLFEGNPKALLEAMSCGLPCVGGDTKGINTIIQDNETGLLSGFDENSIRDRLKVLLADVALRQKLGAAAREYVLKTHTFQEIIKKEQSLYASF